MSFRVERFPREKRRIVLASANDESRVEIIAGCGGTVGTLRLAFGPDESADILYAPGTPLSRESCEPGLFAGRLLWPFNDRIRHGRYAFDGREFQLPVNDREHGDAIHGFLYRTPLDVFSTAADGSSAEVVLSAHTGADDEPGFPFAMTVAIRYRLASDSFTLQIQTTNTGSVAAPLAVGWHPYFTLPGSHPTVDDVTIQNDAPRFVPVGDDLIPLGSPQSVAATPWDFREPRAVGDGEVDICLDGDEPPTTRLSRGDYALEITQELAFTRTQLYIPPGRRAIAVEPVTAAANAFVSPELGRAVLAPGEIHRAATTVRAFRKS